MIYGYACSGLSEVLVSIEVDVSTTIPSWDIVGLPASEVRESRERVKIAIRNSGFVWPNKKVVVNLAPSDIKKTGAGLDLPIAIAILQFTKQIELVDVPIMALGELQLNGVIRPVLNAMPAIMHSMYYEISHYILSSKNIIHVPQVKKGRMLPLHRLKDLKLKYEWKDISVSISSDSEKTPFNSTDISLAELSHCNRLKRAVQISATGRHNIALYGAPGTGKTAAAFRIGTFLPKLRYDQSLILSSLYARSNTFISEECNSISDKKAFITIPPIRKPHHTASVEAMVGSVGTQSIGEVSLAHFGVLILDEAPEFKMKVLQSLREPLDTQRICISRVQNKQVYPADFLLILTCNLCPCGNLGAMDTNNNEEYSTIPWINGSLCMCSEQDIFRYWKRIGGALWDRIDIKFKTSHRGFSDSEEEDEDMRIKDITNKKQEIICALHRQKDRFKGVNISHNSRVESSQIGKYFIVSRDAHSFITKIARCGISERGRAALYKVGRTIADLYDSEIVCVAHIEEAMGFIKNPF